MNINESVEKTHKKILITGANGFIGSAACIMLAQEKYQVFPVVRKTLSKKLKSFGLSPFIVPDINENTQWQIILENIDVVIHAAARVHKMNEDEIEPLLVYRRANVDATKALALQAKAAGVKHFIFLSSIKVNGEGGSDISYSEADAPNPQDPYGASKLEAENAIIEICQNSTMDYTILRLPLVYGINVKANFASLIRLIRRGWPLPLGRINNKRSMLYLGNLLSVLGTCISNKSSYGETFCLSDDDDVSTTRLIRMISKAYSTPTIVFPIPKITFQLLAKILKKETIMARLFGSLTVNSNKVQKTLNWSPCYSVKTALLEMAQKQDEA